MQNLLIIEDNLIQAHFLSNTICKEIPDIKLYNIALTGMEAINIIKEERVDIIILDMKLPDMTGMDIIDFVSKNNIAKYISSILVFTGEMELLSQIVGNQYVFDYCSKINSMDLIVHKIKDLLEQKKSCSHLTSIKDQIKIELENLKYNFSYAGTKYLYECIYECYNKDKIYDINLNKDIYPIISHKYHKTISSIKANIFQATSVMYYEIEEDILDEYFGYNIKSKPKTKDIITIILQKLYQNKYVIF